MKKRILGLIAGVTMVVSLVAGCGNSSSGTDASSAGADTSAAAQGADAAESAAATNAATDSQAAIEDTAQAVADTVEAMLEANGEGKKVGITVPSIGNDFVLALSDAMQDAITATGAEVQFDSAESDVTKQISQIENDITMGCNILVVWAVNGDGVANAVKNAVDQDIPVLAFANEIPTASCSMISASDADMGTACAEIASDWIDENYADAGDGEVDVFVLTASTIPEATWRSDAILEKIKENSKVNIIEAEVPDWNDTGAARTLAENTMLANPDIDVIIAANGASGLGAESFVMSTSSPVEDKSKFAIFCVDETDEIVSKIAASVNDESVLRGTISMGSIDDTIGDLMKAMTPLLNDQEPVDVRGSAAKVTPDTLE